MQAVLRRPLSILLVLVLHHLRQLGKSVCSCARHMRCRASGCLVAGNGRRTECRIEKCVVIFREMRRRANAPYLLTSAHNTGAFHSALPLPPLAFPHPAPPPIPLPSPPP